MSYWRVFANFPEFQSPEALGEWLDNVDMIQPGFAIDTSKLKFRFRSKREDDRAIGDFCNWRGGFFFVSARGYVALAELFNRNGRAFPVKCGRHPYYVVSVDHEVDALDYDRSTIERFGRDEDIKKDVFRLKKIALTANIPGGFDVFRLEGVPDVAFEIIVSDKFKDIYDSAGLTGLLFQTTL